MSDLLNLMQDSCSIPAPKGNDPYVEFERLINNMSSDQRRRFVAKVVLEMHNTLQQSTMRSIIMPIIAGFAELGRQGFYDLRNEGTVELAEMLDDAVRPENRPGLPFI